MNTVTVKINGVEYNLKGRENQEYLLQVAKYVDGKFREISSNNSKLSTTAVAVLSALNVADEYFKAEEEIMENNKKRNTLEERYLTLKERLREVKAESEENNKIRSNEIDKLKNIIYSMEEKIKEVDNLYNTINNLQKELEDTKKELVSEKEELEKDFNLEREELEKNFSIERENLNKSFDVERKGFEKVIEEKENTLELLNLKNEELEKRESSLRNTVMIKEKEIEEVKCNSDEINNLKSKINSVVNEKEMLKKNNKELKFKLQNSKYKVLDLEKKLNDANFNLAIEKKIKNPLLK